MVRGTPAGMIMFQGMRPSLRPFILKMIRTFASPAELSMA